MNNVRDTVYLKALGAHLRRLRIERNVSQENLAHKADIGVNQIWKIENGEINVTACTMKVIAEALDIKPMDLLDF